MEWDAEYGFASMRRAKNQKPKKNEGNPKYSDMCERKDEKERDVIWTIGGKKRRGVRERAKIRYGKQETVDKYPGSEFI